MSVSEEMEKPRKVIGYWMSEKKSQKLNWKEFGNVCREHDFQLVKIDLLRPLEDQGPFSVIIHKLTDIIAKAVLGDDKARKIIQHLESYLDCHPEVAVIDPLQNVRKLLERHHTYRIVNEKLQESKEIFIPTFVDLTSLDLETNIQTLKKAGVTYPFVCKPTIAHGSKNAHKMAIIFNEAGVKDCFPPCVAQSFVSHNAVLYKIFFVGDEFEIVERPSLKNFYPSDQETIFFDSHEVSKADSTSSLSILDPEDLKKLFERNSVKLPVDDIQSLPDQHPLLTPYPPDSNCIKSLRKVLRETLGMKLLGADLVWELGTGRYAIIDINVYPGYDGFPNFFQRLMQCILRTVEERSTKVFQGAGDSSITVPTQNDVCKPTRLRKHCAMTSTDNHSIDNTCMNGEMNGDISALGVETVTSSKSCDGILSPGVEREGVQNVVKDGVVPNSSIEQKKCKTLEGQEVDDSGCDTGDSSDEKKKKELMHGCPQSFRKEMSNGIKLS
ncbi:inositol-tetrakisphosphate 1-kinase-like [Ischnura elegans]|uniref:inositol-tetrakisphosphate 1-kinase-like n=1 Tax=Ischnura elegans TaxID=197161 RepID=UPI001ED88957|nr:inositol-tetrakisphosphate 1-kinase-like [Ischnura elegans]